MTLGHWLNLLAEFTLSSEAIHMCLYEFWVIMQLLNSSATWAYPDERRSQLHTYTHPHTAWNWNPYQMEEAPLMSWISEWSTVRLFWSCCVILSCGWLYSSLWSTKNLVSLQQAATKAVVPAAEPHQCLKEDLLGRALSPCHYHSLWGANDWRSWRTTFSSVPAPFYHSVFMLTLFYRLDMKQHTNIDGGLFSKGRNNAQSHCITHISPRTTKAFVGHMLNYGERKNCRAWYSMSFKNKNKNPTAERLIGQTKLECVGVKKGMKGGPGSGQLLRGLGGGGGR